MRLEKYQGLGNDFLIAFCDVLPADSVASEQAEQLCRRRYSVGADGLIFAVKLPHVQAHVQDQKVTASGVDRYQLGAASQRRVSGVEHHVAMSLWNADGSASEISGNGLRCLAHAVARSQDVSHLDVIVHTIVGKRRCTVSPSVSITPELLETSESSAMMSSTPAMMNVITSSNRRASAAVEMGDVQIDDLPDDVALTSEVVGVTVERCCTANTGNRHVLLLVSDLDALDLHMAGPAVEKLFAGGINVHFMSVSKQDDAGVKQADVVVKQGDAVSKQGGNVIDLKVWERGVGVTEACGTGAVAASAAARSWGYVAEDAFVRMPGGTVRVALSPQTVLTGQSEHVATVIVE